MFYLSYSNTGTGFMDSRLRVRIIGIACAGLAFALPAAAQQQQAAGKETYEEDCQSCHGPDGGAIPSAMLAGQPMPPGAVHGQLAIRQVTILTNAGRTIVGQRMNEDTFTVQVMDREGKLVTVDKSDIRQYDVAKVAGTPPAQIQLSDKDLSDLSAYLVSLKKD